MSISITPSCMFAIIEAQSLCVQNHADVFSKPLGTQAIVVMRALGRFEREFDAYKSGNGCISAVRTYQRMLMDEVKLYIKLRREED